MKKTLLVIPAAATMLVALTACSPGTGAGVASTAPLTGERCIAGDWTADLDDLVQQMAAYFVEHGYDPGLTGTVTGSETGTFDADGTATAQDDATFVFTGTRSGIPVTVTTVRSGGFTSDWSLTGDVFMFTNFVGPNYSIATTLELNGVTTALPTEDTTQPFNEHMAITTDCTGDVMTMKPDVSPFTTTWNRD